MKKWALIAIIIFGVGEVVIMMDSIKSDWEVTLSGKLIDFQPDTVLGRARVEVDDKFSAVNSLSYQNKPWRKLHLEDTISLVLRGDAQYIYSGQLTDRTVKFYMFGEYSLRWLMLLVIICGLLKFFKVIS